MEKETPLAAPSAPRRPLRHERFGIDHGPGNLQLSPEDAAFVWKWVDVEVPEGWHGAMAQNAYLFCASAGLATVIRAWFDASALSAAMGLSADQQLLLCQTVGRTAAGGP